MPDLVNIQNTFGAGRDFQQRQEFNSLRASGERQRQDIQQRTFDAETQRANSFKLLNGIRLAQENPGVLPQVGQELVEAGIINQQELPGLLQRAQTDPESFRQGLEDFESQLMFALSEAPAQPTFGAPVAGVGAEGPEFRRFAPTGESQAVEDFAPPSGGSLAGTAERFFNSLTEDLTPQQQSLAREIQLGLQARAGSSAQERIAVDPGLGGSVADQAAREAQRTTGAKAEETRLQGIISQGQEVADGLPVLRRSLELLDVVSTGGKLREAQLSFAKSLGVETADQGEISANLGKAVLSQLRETFGAQFTEAEGQRLVAIEAGFGKNNDTNRRLLGQAIKIIEAKSNRAIKLARDRGDEATAQIIEDAMRLSLTPGVQDTGATQVGRFTVETVQ